MYKDQMKTPTIFFNYKGDSFKKKKNYNKYDIHI